MTELETIKLWHVNCEVRFFFVGLYISVEHLLKSIRPYTWNNFRMLEPIFIKSVIGQIKRCLIISILIQISVKGSGRELFLRNSPGIYLA